MTNVSGEAGDWRTLERITPTPIRQHAIPTALNIHIRRQGLELEERAIRGECLHMF